MFSSSSLCNDKDAMLRWISENVFKFFFMQWKGCNVKMNKWGCFKFFLCNGKGAMLRWISENVFKFFFMEWQGVLRWISENVFKFFFMEWQGCNVKMNKWGCFEVLLYAMTRMQC